MNTSNWKRLEKVNKYLESKRESGVKGFKQLIKGLEADSATMAVVTFTYENIEVYGKVDGNFNLFNSLFDTLNNYDMDDITSYDYNDQDVLDDYKYSRSNNFASKLTEFWIMECFYAAIQDTPTDIPFYYKSNHDDLEVLDMKSGSTLFEKSEFQMYIDNNLTNTIELLPG